MHCTVFTSTKSYASRLNLTKESDFQTPRFQFSGIPTLDFYVRMCVYRKFVVVRPLMVGKRFSNKLRPSTPDYALLLKKETDFITRQKQNFDLHHCSRQLFEWLLGDIVHGIISVKSEIVQQITPR